MVGPSSYQRPSPTEDSGDPQLGQQFLLNQLSALHDQLALGGIHLPRVMILVSKDSPFQKWPPASFAFAPSSETISPEALVSQEAQL
jgi:hypothetical protein